MVFPLQAVCVIINNMIKKADIILFILILVLGLGGSWWSLAGNSAGDKVVVSVNGETYGIYDLDKNQEITVNSTSNAREQIIGVSTDEELSFMIKFQNAYNASSRYINVIDEMLEHVINTLGS